jgi:hypothetical protein
MGRLEMKEEATERTYAIYFLYYRELFPRTVVSRGYSRLPRDEKPIHGRNIQFISQSKCF